MRRAGVTQLVVAGSSLPRQLEYLHDAERVVEVRKSFPDQHGWLLRLSKHLRADDIGTLMECLHYTQEPELFTMRLCLFCGGSGRLLPPVSLLSSRLRDFCAVHGMAPAPAVLLGKAAREEEQAAVD